MTFIPFSLSETLEDVRREHFPGITTRLSVAFASDGGWLARVLYLPRWRSLPAMIRLHPALDRPDTPLEVVRFLLKHELIHLEVPSVHVRGRRRPLHHPQAFWDRERELSPESREAWGWIVREIGHCLVRYTNIEGEFVVPHRIPRNGQPLWRLYRASAATENQGHADAVSEVGRGQSADRAAHS